jgi:hypothetical protein
MAIYTIYRIRDNTTGETYIGSTKNTLEYRINQHKLNTKKCNSWKILKNNNYTVKSLLEVNCNKTTARWLERFSMENHCNIVNDRRSITTKEERLREMREWHENNNEYQKEYYKNNKEKSREYYKKNKEKISVNNREYYKKQIAKKQSISCQCGGNYTYYNKSRHMKSKKHQNYIMHSHQKL